MPGAVGVVWGQVSDARDCDAGCSYRVSEGCMLGVCAGVTRGQVGEAGGLWGWGMADQVTQGL